MSHLYPPPHHLLSDLDFEVDRSGGDLQVRLPVTPALLDAAGSVRAGVLGLALDVFAGGLSVEAAAPDWALTSELTLHALRPCGAGRLVVTGRALRAGRTQRVVEARVHEAGRDAPVAIGHVGFARVPRRDDTPPSPEEPGGVYTFGDGGTPLAGSLADALGIRRVDAAGDAGALEIPVAPYVQNSVGALQGGVVVTLIDAAACAAGEHDLAAPVVAVDVGTRYLALGRAGPVRSETELLRRDADEALYRVALRDVGQQDRLIDVGTARVRRAIGA
ncbi:MAG: hypothetical protein ACQGVC_07460 [Myxococcota bacterium]